MGSNDGAIRSRRTFFKTAAVATVGAVMGNLATATEPARRAVVSPMLEWNRKAVQHGFMTVNEVRRLVSVGPVRGIA